MLREFWRELSFLAEVLSIERGQSLGVEIVYSPVHDLSGGLDGFRALLFEDALVVSLWELHASQHGAKRFDTAWGCFEGK